jgi:hypothetical protein
MIGETISGVNGKVGKTQTSGEAGAILRYPIIWENGTFDNN